MTIKIEAEYGVSDVREISVEHNGYMYLLIYGKHINGWFCAIPNWKKCAEIAEPTEDGYNSGKIDAVLENKEASKAIALALKKHYEETALGK